MSPGLSPPSSGGGTVLCRLPLLTCRHLELINVARVSAPMRRSEIWKNISSRSLLAVSQRRGLRRAACLPLLGCRNTDAPSAC